MRNLIIVLFCLAFSVSGRGLQVYPMEQYVDAGKSCEYTASNNLDDAIAIEVVCEAWSMDEAGKEISTPTTDLVAYPAQFMLRGNTYKKIKVSFREQKPASDKERCYRVTIRELPISLNAPKPGTFEINYASAYRTSFYELPKNENPVLKVLSGKIENDTLHIALANQGNVHIHLKTPILTFTCEGGQTVECKDAGLMKGFEGENIHAGLKRYFRIDLRPFHLPGRVTAVTAKFLPDGPTRGLPFNLLTE